MVNKQSNEQTPKKLGECLMNEGMLTKEQLEEALKYQNINGGRLGNILVSLGYITKKELLKITKNYTKKRPIGSILVKNGDITEEQLKQALEFQKKSGGMLGDILLSLKMISPQVLYRHLATQSHVGRVGEQLDFHDANKLPFKVARKYNACIVNTQNNRYIVAVVNLLKNKEIEDIQLYLDKEIEQVIASNSEIEYYWSLVYATDLNDESVYKLFNEQPQNSAIKTFTFSQIMSTIILSSIILAGIFINALNTFIVINIIIQVVYFFVCILKVNILLKGINQYSQIEITDDKIKSIDEKKLPIYTILVPMYKETEVLIQLIENLEKLDYPKQKLDIRLLLEEDDLESIELIRSLELPSYYTLLVVPHSIPKTKPKACNYGIIKARGKYIVIYDAEDRPEPDQLKKVYAAFEKMPDEYVCMQAKLNYFNANQNFLTRLFTHEYSMWFEMLLPGVVQLNVPVPLGGTSNHFKVDFLREVGAWDPHNVTEDADLGIRLFKSGYKTAVIDSHTWEEANSKLNNWIRQRSRWLKGYMQTYLVHMRNPVKLLKELGIRGFLGFQAIILGSPLLTLVNPFLWIMIILWYSTHAGWIPKMFPGPIYYCALFLLVIGNFWFVYSNVAGMYLITKNMSKKEVVPFSYSIVKYGLLSPLYWFYMSVAAQKALWQLIFNPFHWEKTQHGLTNKKSSAGGISI